MTSHTTFRTSTRAVRAFVNRLMPICDPFKWQDAPGYSRKELPEESWANRYRVSQGAEQRPETGAGA